MEQDFQLQLLKDGFRKDDEEGFSLIELVVVVSVLAVLAAIALPTFSCITRKAKATSALAAIRQIKSECSVKTEEEGVEASTFVSSNLQGYEIESNDANSCSGASDTGLIRAIPNEPDKLPTFILATNSNELTYSFRGETGTNFTDCLGLICLKSSDSTDSEYNNYDFVVNNAFINNGCSDYIIVEGSTWEEAEANANTLGGNLITINDQDEYSWLQQNVWKNDKLLTDAGSGHDADSTYYFVGLNDSEEEGKYVWSSGQDSEWSNNEDIIHRQNWIAQQHHAASHDYFVVGSNDEGFTDYEQSWRPELYNGQGHGQLAWIDNESSMYQGEWKQPHYGIAEIPACEN